MHVRDEAETIDLSALALRLAVQSVGYGLLALFAAAVILLIGVLAGSEYFKTTPGWLWVGAIWLFLEMEVVRRLCRIAASTPPVRKSTRTLHAVELSVAGFLIVYSLARPYLAAPDAASYPIVKQLFEIFIGVLAFCHCLVLAIFRRKPDRWDVGALGISLAAGIAALV